MKTFGSIRWRLQLWHGALLGLVVAGLGTAVWQLQLSNEYQRIDRELERHVAAVTAGLLLTSAACNKDSTSATIACADRGMGCKRARADAIAHP